MSANEQSVNVALGKLKYNIVSNYVEKNISPEEMLKELKNIKLCNKEMKKDGLERYIAGNLFLVWDNEKKLWKRDIQQRLRYKIPEIEDQESWGSIVNNLTSSQQLDLLKTMKEILTHTKEVSKNIIEITKGIAESTLMIDRLIDRFTEDTEKKGKDE